MIKKYSEWVKDLNESYLDSNRAPLYHFTSLKGIFYIFATGEIKKSGIYGNISLTRDKNFFIINRKGNMPKDSKQVRIEFDTDLLKHNIRIKPFNYFKNVNFNITPQYMDEDEEISDKNIPIKYIKTITIFPENLYKIYNSFYDIKDKDHFKYYKDIMKEIEQLKNENKFSLTYQDVLPFLQKMCDDHNIKLIIE